MTVADIAVTLMTVTDIDRFPRTPRTEDGRFTWRFLMHVFVTGASGWIGSAVVPELIGAGHQVTGLPPSHASAAALTAAPAHVHRGTLPPPDDLRSAPPPSHPLI